MDIVMIKQTYQNVVMISVIAAKQKMTEIIVKIALVICLEAKYKDSKPRIVKNLI